jgi:hypothetical protein
MPEGGELMSPMTEGGELMSPTTEGGELMSPMPEHRPTKHTHKKIEYHEPH